jgi:CDGSH-type Zn-finger protein/uncharacterized Fe-S cluster protein YjdI
VTEQYTGKAMDRRYSGQHVDITYNVKRCIHAEECIHRLSAVFDAKRRPWILIEGTSAEQVALTVQHCPSGALHYEPKDGTPSETTPNVNAVVAWHNGPLQISGDLRIEGAAVNLQEETRATLCRCGDSQNKPFCDNAHKSNGFEGSFVAGMIAVPAGEGGPLKITVMPNGPLILEGAMTIYDDTNTAVFSGQKAALCRCGGSSKKPFCDSTHKTNGFTAE